MYTRVAWWEVYLYIHTRVAWWEVYPGLYTTYPPWEVYPGLYTTHPTHPGYTTVYIHPIIPSLYDEGCGTAGSDGALGSNP